MENHDLQYILSKRYDNGFDFWATPDKKVAVGGAFSSIGALITLSDLGIDSDHEAIVGGAEILLGLIRPDGRIKISPKGSIFPCHMAVAAVALCKNGYANNEKVKLMLDYLLNSQHTDGGWRCKKFLYGRGPETEYSNPGVTLMVLDAFRCAGLNNTIEKLDQAVESLLRHWEVKTPIGPCHFGIGSQFMKVEYPFLRYNIFYFAYVLSFYRKAIKDKRYVEVLKELEKKIDHNGMILVERPNPKLSTLDFCMKGKPSLRATVRYNEILANLMTYKDA